MTFPGMPFAAPEGHGDRCFTEIYSSTHILPILYTWLCIWETVGTVNNFNDTIGMMTSEIKTLSSFL